MNSACWCVSVGLRCVFASGMDSVLGLGPCTPPRGYKKPGKRWVGLIATSCAPLAVCIVGGWGDPRGGIGVAIG